jgi:uncharacterized phage protein gp47/JayE
MAWQSQTLPELIQRVEQDFSARFFGTSAPLRRSVLKVLARVWAAIVFLLTLFLEWIYRNGFLHLCDPDQVPLHCTPIGIYQTSAQFADGFVAGTGTPSEIIDQGTVIQDTDGTVQYETVEDVEIDTEGEFTVQITSQDGGAQYNQEIGTVLQFQSSDPGYDTEVTVIDDGNGNGIAGGDDLEDLEDTRDRGLYKKQNPPQGGAEADYVIWATSRPNVTAAYITEGYPQANNVQVVVADYDKTQATPPSPPTVSPADVQRVQDYITDPQRKPLTSVPIASSVIPSGVTMTAAIRPNTPANREAATKEVRSLFVATGIPHSVIPDETILATIARTYGIEAVELPALLQEGVQTDRISLGFQGVAWLDGITFQDLVV